jgi:hypothetical protein
MSAIKKEISPESVTEEREPLLTSNNNKYLVELNNSKKIDATMLFTPNKENGNSINNHQSMGSDESGDLKLDPLGLGLSIEGKNELNQ